MRAVALTPDPWKVEHHEYPPLDDATRRAIRARYAEDVELYETHVRETFEPRLERMRELSARGVACVPPAWGAGDAKWGTGGAGVLFTKPACQSAGGVR